MEIKGEKEQIPMQVTDAVLQQLYNKLHSKCYTQNLLATNANLGSYYEPHDYVQDTLITLVKKLRAKKVEFYSFQALWTWCYKVLGMRLLNCHRDHTYVQSRKGRTVDISGESASGTKTEDIASLEMADIKAQPEKYAQQKELKEFILAYSGTNAQIVHIHELYTVDASCTVINVATVLESIAQYGIRNGLLNLDIPKISHSVITDVLVDFVGAPTIGNKIPEEYKPRVLGSIEREYLKQIKKESAKNDMITLEDLERALSV